MAPLILKDELSQQLHYPAELLPAFVLVCFALTEKSNQPSDLSDPPFSAIVKAGEFQAFESPAVNPEEFFPDGMIPAAEQRAGVKAAVFAVPPGAGHVTEIILRLRYGAPVKILAITAGAASAKQHKSMPREKSLEETDPTFYARNRENPDALTLLKEINHLLSVLLLMSKGFETGSYRPHDGNEEIAKDTVRLLTMATVGAMRSIHQTGGDPLAWLRTHIERADALIDNSAATMGLRRELALLSELKPWLPKDAQDGQEDSGG